MAALSGSVNSNKRGLAMWKVLTTVAVLVAGGALLLPVRSARACCFCHKQRVCYMATGYSAPPPTNAQPFGYAAAPYGFTPFGYTTTNFYGSTGAAPYGYPS